MSSGEIVRVCVGLPAPLTFAQKTAATGILKRPIVGPVDVTEIQPGR